MTDWQLTIDSIDPKRQVAFWAPLLDYRVQPAPDGFESWNAYYVSIGVPEDELDHDGDGADRIYDPTGAGPTIWFQAVREKKVDKNRLHLDVYPTGRDQGLSLDERARIVEEKVEQVQLAGASVLRRFPADFPEAGEVEGYFVVMADPEGNEFCIG
ncbi:hypothetical protein BJ980_003183 [Nocardioides daedukensis]|uniref:Glyoxalase-like domain-containing protein n=1 Tax=Nocardioides daedukensis TaxID=634462 RepID=A0A7Y9S6D9_9ACTN|nr:hypothetical protein [Nocardioides daedukensis]